ncbi:hypothetical protein C3B55_00722 [Candidatus Pseudomonas adelgestsugas]|uniref:Uncharacterized protein n=1 Tax=Candidatus Pseudomonas adelgestsugas TaxID=1302376 RepID=A0ABX5R8S6_9PSED|nr:hypothetical protein C3B55_00722 [Candidatus Pseudomonas adelgestsugas]
MVPLLSSRVLKVRSTNNDIITANSLLYKVAASVVDLFNGDALAYSKIAGITRSSILIVIQLICLFK